VPAYVVFADRTLRDIARALPSDTQALSRVRGIGPAKLAKFGAEVLELVRQTTAG